MRNGCWQLINYLSCVGGGSNASHAVGGSVKREKVGTFSLSFLAVTLNFYDILAAQNYAN